LSAIARERPGVRVLPRIANGLPVLRSLCCARDCSTLAFGHIGLESTAFAPYYAATPIVALLCGWGMGTACATAGAVCAFAFFLLSEIGPSGTKVSAAIDAVG
jgi:hypothetical protein